MPTYHTPPQTPINSSSSLPSLARSNSYTQSASASSRSSRSSRSSGPSKHGSSSKQEEHSHHKAPYVFLGSIAAASLLAHKYWPKGYPHGDKEDWELSKWALRAKERRQAEKAARRGGGSSRDSREFLPSATYANDEREVRYADYSEEGRGRARGREGYYLPREDAAYNDRRQEWAPANHWESNTRESSFGRGRSRSRDRGQDGYGEMGSSSSSSNNFSAYRRASSTTRSSSRERHHHYPPAAPQRYLLEEQSVSTTGPSTTHAGSRYLLEPSKHSVGSSAGSRFVTSEGAKHWRYYDQDRPEEVVYVYRDVPTRSRRASFDAGGGARRYEGEYDWPYR